MAKRTLLVSVIFGIAGLAALFFLAAGAFADDAGKPPSSEPDTSIGAWYDETWQAVGFYNLVDAGSDEVQYEYTDNATSADPGPSADMVVTEWDVTGHLHFSSGL